MFLLIMMGAWLSFANAGNFGTLNLFYCTDYNYRIKKKEKLFLKLLFVFSERLSGKDKKINRKSLEMIKKRLK